VAIDRDADLSALEIAMPPGPAAPIALDVDAAATLTACGFGPSGEYRCIAGRIVGTATSAGQESLQIAGAVRSGDSGGGVFDERGQLVAVVWGERDGVTYATSGAPLRQFVERAFGRQPAAPVATCPTGRCPTATCPNGMCPLVRPITPGAAAAASPPAVLGGSGAAAAGTPSTNSCPCNCNGACGTQLAAITARVDALEAGKQNRGDYLDASALAPLAHTDQLAAFDRESRERHASLVERLEALAPLFAAAGRAAAPAAMTALGISGPIGWGILAAMSAGSWLIGRRLRRRRSHPASSIQNPASRSTPPEATAAAEAVFRSTSETHAPLERDDREARELLRLSQLEGRDPLQDALGCRQRR
jgi:hypothetical protein